LVNQVFRFQSPSERLFFSALSHKNNPVAQGVIRLFGVKEIVNFWVALGEKKDVLGTTGLYRYIKDQHEALWLAWFCVAPKARGTGMGKKLLSFSVTEAEKVGVRYLRLYTSDDPIESKAQYLYENFGLKEVGRQRKIFHTRIYRELKLQH
jgi:GNAT superfamily N-acetyltransferase